MASHVADLQLKKWHVMIPKSVSKLDRRCQGMRAVWSLAGGVTSRRNPALFFLKQELQNNTFCARTAREKKKRLAPGTDTLFTRVYG